MYSERKRQVMPSGASAAHQFGFAIRGEGNQSSTDSLLPTRRSM